MCCNYHNGSAKLQKYLIGLGAYDSEGMQLSCYTWFTLGISLNINVHTLRKIDMDYRIQGVNRCLVEMIDVWEKQSSPPKLSELLRALIISSMQCKAVDIAEAYGKYDNVI